MRPISAKKAVEVGMELFGEAVCITKEKHCNSYSFVPPDLQVQNMDSQKPKAWSAESTQPSAGPGTCEDTLVSMFLVLKEDSSWF